MAGERASGRAGARAGGANPWRIDHAIIGNAAIVARRSGSQPERIDEPPSRRASRLRSSSSAAREISARSREIRGHVTRPGTPELGNNANPGVVIYKSETRSRPSRVRFSGSLAGARRRPITDGFLRKRFFSNKPAPLTATPAIPRGSEPVASDSQCFPAAGGAERRASLPLVSLVFRSSPIETRRRGI